MYKRNIRKFIYIIFFVVLLCFGVGYASLNSSLFIDGVAIINSSIFEVNFQNTKVNPQSIVAESPTIDGNTISGNLAFSRTGEFYEFTFDVVNSGNVDAMIDSFDFTPKVSGSMSNYLTYDISYDNGEQIALKQSVNEDSFVRIKSKIEYIGQNTDSDFYVNFSINLNYVMEDGNSTEVLDGGLNNIRPTAYGSLEDIGTVVTIGTEKFYTIGTDGDNVKLFSMYNLYVGGIYNVSSDKITAYGNETTGLQDSNMLGWVSGASTYAGAVQYSEVNNNYDGSIVQTYVNDYETLLEYKYDLNIVNSRLISYDELVNTFSCDLYDENCLKSPYTWIYSTSYWADNGDIEEQYVYHVFTNSGFGYDSYNDNRFGVRPVIIIPKSDIVVNQVYATSSGSLDRAGSIVTIGTEKFYTIGTEGDNVKLLSMYNLNVGYELDTSSWSGTLINNPTGMQDSKMLGLASGLTTYYGVTSFSSGVNHGVKFSDYNGSDAEVYVNNYKGLLKTKFNFDALEARLITYDELSNTSTFACTDSSACSFSYPWIYSTSYWTKTPYSDYDLYGVQNINRKIYIYDYDEGFFALGIRPVIVVPKYLIKETAKILTFSVGNYTLYAQENMTWGEWVGSLYNTVGVSSSLKIPGQNGGYIYYYPGTDTVDSPDYIIDNEKYILTFMDPIV